MTEIDRTPEPTSPGERSAVDYLLRTQQQNLVQFSSIADQKANIVLGASLIMITIIVTIASSSGLTASMATLGSFAVASSIMALLAVMPSNRRRDVDRRNPLFFADAAEMTSDEHRAAMSALIEGDGAVYAGILDDLHAHAFELQRGKFRFLRYAYLLFIVGLLCTTVVLTLEWASDVI